MTVPSRSSLSLALLLTLAGACAEVEDTPNDMEFEPIVSDAGSDAGSTDGSFVWPSVDSGSLPPSDAALPDAALPDAAVATDGAVVADGGDDAGPTVPGTCCPDGKCLCRGDAPTALTSAKGPYKTAELKLPLGTVTYPTDAAPPFAAVALCGGFTNTGPEMAPWAPFYASHGIVTIITTTGGLDDPNLRGTKLLAALDQLKAENSKSGSPLLGKLDVDRLGTSGYSMGGGGTTLASVKTPTLKTSVGLAAWGPANSGIKVPTLYLCGSSDGTAPCNTYSQPSYNGISEPTPKMMVTINGANHFAWFGPTDAGMGISGKYALAFQKVYLEGDLRWKELLISKLSGSTQATNIK